MRKFFKVGVIVFFSMVNFLANAQETKEFKPSINPYLNVQFWNVYSTGYSLGEEDYANRISPYFRRGRAGLKGKLDPSLSYNLMLYFDYLAKDPYLSSKGTPNTGTIGVWSANITWKMSKITDAIHITFGTFLPYISRESVTNPWTTSSLDKAETSCYLRQFVTGKTNGICPGINIGGLLKLHKSLLNYNLAIVNRQDKTSISKTEWSPVLNGHVMLNLGDPEWKSYKYSINNNNYKIQKSLTIGFGASNQGKTDAFKNSSSISANFMAYYNYIKIDGSYSKLIRKAGSNYKAHCYSIRGAANIPITKGWIIEPQFMWDCFKGDANYSDASFFDGTDHIVDSGVNAISGNKKIKIGLHHIMHSGNGTKNHFISADKSLGNYACLAIQLKI